MTAGVAEPGFYADFGELAALRRSAQAQDPAALRETARQFESLFARMMLSSMRAASFGDSLFGSDQQDFYQGMFDDQLAVELTRGRGLGLAEMLVEQLTRAGLAPAEAAGADQNRGGAAAQSDWRPATRNEFIEELRPHAERAADELGVDPRALLAQAALETNWGSALPVDGKGHTSFNLFGIKAGEHWSGPAVSVGTLEFENGLPIRRHERFRVYDSLAASFADYVALLRNNPRYAAALNTRNDTASFAQALQQGGYATDPHYASKLTAIAQNLELPRETLKSAAALPITPRAATF